MRAGHKRLTQNSHGVPGTERQLVPEGKHWCLRGADSQKSPAFVRLLSPEHGNKQRLRQAPEGSCLCTEGTLGHTKAPLTAGHG